MGLDPEAFSRMSKENEDYERYLSDFQRNRSE